MLLLYTGSVVVYYLGEILSDFSINLWLITNL